MAFLRGSSIYCIGKEEIDVPKRVAFSSVCITTATISSFGAIVQLVNWYKKLRETEIRRVLSPTPHVVFSLAMADLFTCLGAIAMSILFLIFEPAKRDKDGHLKPFHMYYVWIGMPIESFTMFSYIASYMWTLFYSVDICLKVHNLQSSIRSQTYHVLSWPVAACLVACVQVIGYEGDTKKCLPAGFKSLLHYLVCYVPLLLVMFSLPVIYWKAYKKVSQNLKRSGYFTDVERTMQKSVRRRFCLILSVFALCWLPNFVDGFHDIVNYIIKKKSLHQDKDHFGIWMLEASVNPLQGILNCLVYGQHRQFVSFCSHILSLRHSASPPNNDEFQERNRALTINSFSGSVKIPVSEISPLLSGSRRNTPVTPQPASHSPREVPFAARLLGEFSR